MDFCYLVKKLQNLANICESFLLKKKVKSGMNQVLMNRFLPRGIMSRLLKLFLAQIFALADSTVFAGGCGSTVSAGFGGSMVFSSCGGLTVLMG